MTTVQRQQTHDDFVRMVERVLQYCNCSAQQNQAEIQKARRELEEMKRIYQQKLQLQQQQLQPNHAPGGNNVRSSGSSSGGYYSQPPLCPPCPSGGTGSRPPNIKMNINMNSLGSPQFASTPNPGLFAQRDNLCSPARPPSGNEATTSPTGTNCSTQPGNIGFQVLQCPQCNAKLGVIFQIIHLHGPQ